MTRDELIDYIDALNPNTGGNRMTTHLICQCGAKALFLVRSGAEQLPRGKCLPCYEAYAARPLASLR